ncbi:MAG: hypothetical protein SCK29_08730 [Bacillota bacterium]|nr:hypothetical protein [Bacillota bacterium]MDW7684183.1 hypothetical protein [Bacillota bacterium]
MLKFGERTLVLLIFAAAIIMTLSVTGCGEKEPEVETVASDSCVACHISPEIIDSMYTPPESAGGGG